MNKAQKDMVESLEEYLDDWFEDNPDQKTHMIVIRAHLKAMELNSD